MQVFFVRGLELDRCRGCGRVWLDLDEVDRTFGISALDLSEAEVDAQCPRGHGVLVESTVRGQPALACSRCHGALVDPANVAARPDAPMPEEVKVSCDRCLIAIPLSEAVNTSGGVLCRECELGEPPSQRNDPGVGGPAWGLVQLLDLLGLFFS